jgi:hypothetical protein
MRCLLQTTARHCKMQGTLDNPGQESGNVHINRAVFTTKTVY